MDIYDAIQMRKSVRRFKEMDIPQETLLKVLEAARLAPSAKNKQEWRFVVVRDQETRQKLAQAARNQQFVAQAPVVIACCAETDNYLMTCGQLSYPIDVAIALDHLTLAAVAEGLGTCWIGAFYEDQVKHILQIPDPVRVVQLLPLGYPDDPAPAEKRRLPLKEILHWNRW